MTKSFKMLAKSYPALLLFLTCAILFMAPDIHAQESGLINVNPDPDGEPWIAGGITREEWDRMTADLPSLDQILSTGTCQSSSSEPAR